MAHLEIEWTDTENRIVERRKFDTALNDTKEINFTLDPHRAIAMLNSLRVRLSIDVKAREGAVEHRRGDERATFTVVPAAHGWSDYEIIMWHERTVEQLAVLKRMGVSAGKVNGNSIELADTYMRQQAEPLLQSNLRWYVENIATDFYSAYHRWFSNRPVNWRFLEAKELYRRDLTGRAAFIRDPSLSDPTWLSKISDRLKATVRLHRPYRPLYYNLGDEPGVQDLASFWDFDFSKPSLQQMRLWLKQHYPNLAALNAEWGTHFHSWNDVVPSTTREAMRRSDDNFAPWADFKEWMDVAFARALRVGTNAVHSADPEALAAIEGAQIPGWGGYNYSYLADAIDLMEIYDFAGNVDIVRSLNSKLLLVTTSGGGGAREESQIWRELLRGSRGLILWDEKSELVHPDGSLGTWGQGIEPLFHELRGGLGALVVNSVEITDPVAVLYSPASMRTQWMLDQKPKGDAWIDRDADAEYQDNVIRASTRHFTDGLVKLGYHYRYITPDLIERRILRRGDFRVLVLPHALAMSRTEATEIRRFVAHGGIVIADGVPGVFDEHSRRLATPLLAGLFSADPVARGGRRGILLEPPAPTGADSCIGAEALQPLAQSLRSAGLAPRFTVQAQSGRPAPEVRSYIYRNGNTNLVALQRDDCPVSSASAATGGASYTLTLPRSDYVYDVRARKGLGRQNRIDVVLDPVSPIVLALAPEPLASPVVQSPAQMRLGQSAEARIVVKGTSPNARRVLHVDVADPTGKIVSYYSGNVIATGGMAKRRLTFALNDPPGTWEIRVTDIMSGVTTTSRLTVVDQ